MTGFKKKIFTYKTLSKDTLSIVKKLPKFTSTYSSKRISKAFAQKIMLAVSVVNGCNYCSWVHSKLALIIGNMDSASIKNMLKTELLCSNISEYEIVGLAYAQHYAATDKKPDPDATEIFYEFYGQQKAEDIMLYMEAIFFANLAGNTFDAFISRLKGEAALNSNVVFEFIFFLLSAPLLAPLVPFVKRQLNKNKKEYCNKR